MLSYDACHQKATNFYGFHSSINVLRLYVKWLWYLCYKNVNDAGYLQVKNDNNGGKMGDWKGYPWISGGFFILSVINTWWSDFYLVDVLYLVSTEMMSCICRYVNVYKGWREEGLIINIKHTLSSLEDKVHACNTRLGQEHRTWLAFSGF